MAWSLEGEDAEDLYWEARRQREAETPHTLERWFRRRVFNLAGLEREVRFGMVGRVDAALDWYWTYRQSFLQWRDVEHFGGDGYNSGAWHIDADAVLKAYPYAIRGGDEASQVRYFLEWCLDRDPLDAPHVPEEPSGWWIASRNPDRTQRQLQAQRRKVEKQRDRWPRACKTCGTMFVPDRPRNARAVTQCGECKGGAKR